MATAQFADVRASLPPLNLPSSISFPASVAEAVEAVQYAKENALRISIKTSGHSYPGSNGRKNQLQLNLRGMPKYAATSITDCVGQAAEGAPCRLALARNKSAVVRVGGGELWDDLYRAVIARNANQNNSNFTVLFFGFLLVLVCLFIDDFFFNYRILTQNLAHKPN